MKKLLLFFAAAAVALSCDPPQNAWHLEIRNNTEQSLKFNYIAQRHRDSPAYGVYNSVTIPQGETLSIYGTTTNTGERYRMRLEDYFIKSAASYGEDVYWQLLSEDDIVLKTWSYSNKGLPDQRFFEESSWIYDHKLGEGARIEIDYTWTFDILPKDIQQTEQ